MQDDEHGEWWEGKQQSEKRSQHDYIFKWGPLVSKWDAFFPSPFPFVCLFVGFNLEKGM